MSFTKSIRVMFVILIGAAALVSCAKKDSDFKGRKNAAGANLVGSAAANDRAAAAAAASGYVPDIMAINPPQFTAQGVTVTSQIKVNTSLFNISITNTAINQLASVSGATVGDLMLEASGQCADAGCAVYYLQLKFSRANQPVEQIVMKKFFGNADGSNDFYITRGPSEFMSFLDAKALLDAGAPEESGT